MDHLKELANDPDGTDQEFFHLAGIARFDFSIGYDPTSPLADERWCIDGDFYSTAMIRRYTHLIEYINTGVLYYEPELPPKYTDTLYFTIGQCENEQALIELSNRIESIILLGRKTWLELAIPPKEIKTIWHLRENTILYTLHSSDQIQVSTPRRVNYPPDVDWYDWCKVIRREESEGK